MDQVKRLRKLARVHEQVNQALLGAQWEERYALYKLKTQVENEIREIGVKVHG